jgi:hypothetical protein
MILLFRNTPLNSDVGKKTSSIMYVSFTLNIMCIFEKVNTESTEAFYKIVKTEFTKAFYKIENTEFTKAFYKIEKNGIY